MKDTLLAWWAERTPREQIMLRILGAIVAPFLVWLLILRPLGPAREAAEVRHAKAVDTLAEAHAQAAALRQLRKNPPPPLGSPITEFVRAAANETGFQLSRADPVGSDGVIIAIVSARPAAFFEWTANLERRGVFVEQLTVRANPDATIGVDAQLRARAS